MSAAKPIFAVYDPEGPVPLSQNPKRWTVVWPAYINRALTVAQGRRLPKDTTVENPTLGEIAQCCKELGLPHIVEVGCVMYPPPLFVSSRASFSITQLHLNYHKCVHTGQSLSPQLDSAWPHPCVPVRR